MCKLYVWLYMAKKNVVIKNETFYTIYYNRVPPNF